MAHTKSQKKRNRQTIVRNRRNRALRSELNTRARTVHEAVEAGDAESAETALRTAQKRLDQAAAKGVLNANTAARRKSSLTRRVRSMSASSASSASVASDPAGE